MNTNLFDYYLPPDRIAQSSIEPRDQARLLVVHRDTGALEDHHVYDLVDLLQPGDLLVMNNSKVFKARLRTNQGIEIFLLRPEASHWFALIKPGRKVRANDVLTLADGSRVTVIAKRSDGTTELDFQKTPDEVFALTDRLGEIPIPPYVKTKFDDPTKYQTVYAKDVGSVAAPTAGFHFTSELLERLKARGIKTAFVTLHVGLGTFRPMKTETLEEHKMHEEWIDVPEETIHEITRTREQGGRIIAVGTTTVRALESVGHSTLPASRHRRGSPSAARFTSLFITPGFRFKVVDAMITNFHLPKSTLLVLVSSFASRELILKAYQHAIDHDYRFYSFGDAMLIE